MAGDQLFIWAPSGRDADAIAHQLSDLASLVVAESPQKIIEAIESDTISVAVITDDALVDFDGEALAHALARQPLWADCPFIVVIEHEIGDSARAQLLEQLGNATVVEWHLNPYILHSAVQIALRARGRQRVAAFHFQAREEVQAQYRALAASLEREVAERTAALRESFAERQAVEDRLRESEEHYRLTIELIGQIPWVADADGRLLQIGKEWFDRTGFLVEEALRQGWQIALYPDDVDRSVSAWEAAVASLGKFDIAMRIRDSRGSYRWYRSRAAPRLDAQGHALKWYGTLEDIDEQQVATARLQQTQSELIHVSRLTAMGTMASTLAHELNQPLTAVANYLRGTRRLIEAGGSVDDVRAALIEADRSVVRAGEIVRHVRQMVATGDVDRQHESLDMIVREACRIAMIDAHLSGVTHKIRLGSSIRHVMVDRVQIQQVLLNLLRNSIEALEGQPKRFILISTRHRDDQFCEVAIKDTGAGIPEPVAARLFDFLNTSKASGTGIGLSISRTIIEAHGGKIWYEPRPLKQGAIFKFTVPYF